MSQIKEIIDFFTNAIYNVYLNLSTNLGIWFGVILAARFIVPWFFKLVRRLRSGTK